MEHAALALTARVRESSGVIAGRVRIAMAPEFASHWLAPHSIPVSMPSSHTSSTPGLTPCAFNTAVTAPF